MASIRVDGVTKRYGSETVFEDLSLDVHEGEFLVIVGASGCGKSTLLRMIAGIEPVDGGTVHLDDTDVTFMRPGERDVAMVFQDYALYPHMSIRRNLAFPLESHRLSKAEIRARIQQTSTMLELDKLLDRKPGQVSGGQRQRVALGRAMIRNPRAYLMDEPLSNLDAALRVQMRTELIQFHQRTGATVVYVTHDQVEAMTMGQRIAVMRAGRFEQIGVPQEVYRRPSTRFVGAFLGSPKMNIVGCKVGNRELRMGTAVTRIDVDLQTASLVTAVGFRPEAVTMAQSREALDEGLAFDLVPRFTEHLGNEVIVHGELQGEFVEPVVARVSPEVGETVACDGSSVRVRVRRSDLHLFAENGAAVWHGCDRQFARGSVSHRQAPSPPR
jgi:ABC-type sugar transport system ATPase subunit